MIKISNLVIKYRSNLVVRDTTLSIADNDFYQIVVKSEDDKKALIKGLLKPTLGSITKNNEKATITCLNIDSFKDSFKIRSYIEKDNKEISNFIGIDNLYEKKFGDLSEDDKLKFIFLFGLYLNRDIVLVEAHNASLIEKLKKLHEEFEAPNTWIYITCVKNELNLSKIELIKGSLIASESTSEHSEINLEPRYISSRKVFGIKYILLTLLMVIMAISSLVLGVYSKISDKYTNLTEEDKINYVPDSSIYYLMPKDELDRNVLDNLLEISENPIASSFMPVLYIEGNRIISSNAFARADESMPYGEIKITTALAKVLNESLNWNYESLDNLIGKEVNFCFSNCKIVEIIDIEDAPEGLEKDTDMYKMLTEYAYCNPAHFRIFNYVSKYNYPFELNYDGVIALTGNIDFTTKVEKNEIILSYDEYEYLFGTTDEAYIGTTIELSYDPERTCDVIVKGVQNRYTSINLSWFMDTVVNSYPELQEMEFQEYIFQVNTIDYNSMIELLDTNSITYTSFKIERYDFTLIDNAITKFDSLHSKCNKASVLLLVCFGLTMLIRDIFKEANVKRFSPYFKKKNYWLMEIIDKVLLFAICLVSVLVSYKPIFDNLKESFNSITKVTSSLVEYKFNFEIVSCVIILLIELVVFSIIKIVSKIIRGK